MSSPDHNPSTEGVRNHSPNREGERTPTKSPRSPRSPIGGHFLLPSPIPTKRNRTYSASERARAEPEDKGTIKTFCREKGHGFVLPEDGSELLFLHISDIDGDYIPQPGDVVQYQKCLIPPKNEKYSAVHVKIVALGEGKHMTWDSALEHSSSPK